jgi:hypothetical protein
MKSRDIIIRLCLFYVERLNHHCIHGVFTPQEIMRSEIRHIFADTKNNAEQYSAKGLIF